MAVCHKWWGMPLKKMNQCHFRCLGLHQSLITSIDRWNCFLPPAHRRHAIFHLKGKHLIPPLTFSTKIQSNQIICLAGFLRPSVEYGLFLASGVMECVLTGPGEKKQFTAKLGVQPMFMSSEGRLKIRRSGLHVLVRIGGGLILKGKKYWESVKLWDRNKAARVLQCHKALYISMDSPQTTRRTSPGGNMETCSGLGEGLQGWHLLSSKEFNV